MKTVKFKPDSIGLIALRNELGSSQELLALYLNVNLSTLKMAEAGHRPLPTNALIKVAELIIRLAAKPTKTIFKDAHPAEQLCPEILKDHCRLLESKQNKCAEACALLERELKLMVSHYNKARKRLETIDELMSEDETGGRGAAAWLQHKESATSLLIRYGKPVQALLQARISLLYKEMEMYKELKLQTFP